MSTFRRYIGSLRPPPLIATTIYAVQILALGHFITSSIVEVRRCQGFSMLPTIAHDGVWVLVSPLPYFNLAGTLTTRPARGDLVYATKPSDPRETVIKRVLGVEGDLIEIEPRRGSSRNWTPPAVDAGFLAAVNESQRKGEGGWIKVPKGSIWLAGDNMSNSTDSRDYGPLPLAMVKGKVLAQIWPGFKRFQNPVRHLEGPVID